MDRKISLNVLSLLILLGLPRCSMGGIVDNGDKPVIPVGRSTAGIAINGILGGFEVFVPDTSWTLAAGATDDSASIAGTDGEIEFSRAGATLLETCKGEREKNNAGVVMIACDATHTAFSIEGGDVIEASFNIRNDPVTQILRSFRKTTGKI